MKQVKKLSKTINDLSIAIVLFFFYLIFIGATLFLQKIFSKSIKIGDSYWIHVKKDTFTMDYFRSQY